MTTRSFSEVGSELLISIAYGVIIVAIGVLSYMFFSWNFYITPKTIFFLFRAGVLLGIIMKIIHTIIRARD